MIHSSILELSESALKKNVRFLKSVVGTGVTFCSVIKGNAYGHGIETFVPLAERCGVRHFAVASAGEALRVHKSITRHSDLMIMGLIDDHDLPWAIENGVSFYVFDLQRLQAAATVARKVGAPARVHLEMETGMNRTGFELDGLEPALELIARNADVLRVEGVCTHFAGAESVSNFLRIQRQIELFHQRLALLDEQGIRPQWRHAACSAATLVYPETTFDLVRVGIAQYGFWPTEETRMHYILQSGFDASRASRWPDPLHRVLSWKSQVMAIKTVKAGEFVGYGNAYLTTRTTKLATIPVGYYHGFARNLSNLGHVLVRGRRAPVAGVVNMNMMLVDVTDIPGAVVGDEVVLIGKQKKAKISVASFSDMSRYLNYEVLVRLPADIPRVVVA